MKIVCVSFVVNEKRSLGIRDSMIYGHFIEHFHRQIYGGVYDPDNPLSDEDGFRKDVLDAMKKIKVPILRWPGGCFVSSYHWKDAVGNERKPFFDKAWRVEEPNTFGTDEYIKLCNKIGCEPYICTNAGTGTAEEMSDWVEYCNLEDEGQYAKWRINNGHKAPFKVKYWSVGNENYGSWEIGAKSCDEWGRLVNEASKMIKHVDPSTELSAAALIDLDWNINLLKNCSEQLDWISIHEYWDTIHNTNNYANYEETIAFTSRIEDSIKKVRGLLLSMGLENKIKIAYDEWNLRGWYHPNIHTVKQGLTKEEYLYPRDKNDDNSKYTMADAVFTACFLNTCNRNCDIVGMANFAPIVNTRGCIYTHEEGIVLRSTYHVFDLFVNILGSKIIDIWCENKPIMTVLNKEKVTVNIDVLDFLATLREDGVIVVSVINKHPSEMQSIKLSFNKNPTKYRIHSIVGDTTEAYNDIGHNCVNIEMSEWLNFSEKEIPLHPHSVNAIEFF